MWLIQVVTCSLEAFIVVISDDLVKYRWVYGNKVGPKIASLYSSLIRRRGFLITIIMLASVLLLVYACVCVSARMRGCTPRSVDSAVSQQQTMERCAWGKIIASTAANWTTPPDTHRRLYPFITYCSHLCFPVSIGLVWPKTYPTIWVLNLRIEFCVSIVCTVSPERVTLSRYIIKNTLKHKEGEWCLSRGIPKHFFANNCMSSWIRLMLCCCILFLTFHFSLFFSLFSKEWIIYQGRTTGSETEINLYFETVK